MRLFHLIFSTCFAYGVLAFYSLAFAESADSPDRDFSGFEDVTELQPLWEFGVGGGLGEVPNYPASSERNFIALAAPYVVYRGDVFRVGGGGGARAVVVDESNYEFDISLGGAFAAENDDNGVRQGMPDLDYLFELGPQFVYKLRDFNFAKGGNGRLNFRLQTRAVFSTDFSGIDHQGFVVEPVLSYQQRGRLFADTSLTLSISSTFASRDLHAYFYSVAPEFSTAERATYEAKGGYLGTEIYAGLGFPVGTNVRAFIGGTLQLQHGAANTNSPLFEDKLTYSVGVGFVWRLYQSKTRASW
ncbi:MipA/OmpV family protein [Alteromonas flava]|uniref:MipA/OmpV family protein n=1 Tax=Alteromonas flava TaxID=2048003 RepID=UPI000C288C6C|nr:MipA/OmpV family protein [Alteromonas flava]